jgi:hypothetical protein
MRYAYGTFALLQHASFVGYLSQNLLLMAYASQYNS